MHFLPQDAVSQRWGSNDLMRSNGEKGSKEFNSNTRCEKLRIFFKLKCVEATGYALIINRMNNWSSERFVNFLLQWFESLPSK